MLRRIKIKNDIVIIEGAGSHWNKYERRRYFKFWNG